MSQTVFSGSSGDVGLLNANFTELYSLYNRLLQGTYAIGLDAAPSAWDSSFRALQLSGGSAVAGSAGNMLCTANAFFSTSWTRVATGETSAYVQSSGTHIWYSDASGAGGGTYTPTERMRLDTTALKPGADNAATCGSASKRWSTVYAGTGSINTSDAREKTDIAALTNAELAAAKLLAAEIGTYQWLESVQAKGSDARTHVGLTVQRAIEIMQGQDLDPTAYGFICHDEWQADEREGIEAGDRYAFRTDELLLFIARGFEARLAALEAALP